MYKRREILVEKIREITKYDLYGSIRTFNRTEDSILSDNLRHSIQADEDYRSDEKLMRLNATVAELMMTYDENNRVLEKLKTTKFADLLNLPQSVASASLFSSCIQNHIKIASMTKNKTHKQLKESLLQLDFYRAYMGVRRGALLCHELATLALFEMLKMNCKDSYSTIVFSCRGNTNRPAHVVAAIGLSFPNEEILKFEVNLDEVITNNPDAIILDLWNKNDEIFPIGKLPDKIRALVSQRQLHPVESFCHVSIQRHIENISTLNLHEMYPSVSQEFMTISNLLKKNPLTRSPDCIGWCEPPPNSGYDEQGRTTLSWC